MYYAVGTLTCTPSCAITTLGIRGTSASRSAAMGTAGVLEPSWICSLYERKRNGAAACTRNVFCAREIAWLSSAIIHHQGPLAPAFVRSVRCDIRSQRCTRSGGANRLWWRGRPWRTRGEERGGRRGPEKRVHEWRRGMRSCLLVPVRFRKRRRAGGGVIGPAT